MLENVKPSCSQTAISIAFKKARRKFPKNFGLTPTCAEKENSENEDSSSCKNEQDPNLTIKSRDSICHRVESGLIDSFKELRLSKEPEIIFDSCQDESENVVTIDLKSKNTILDERTICENVYLEKQDYHFDYDCENELPTKSDPSNDPYCENRHNIDLIWNGESDHCDNYDSEIDDTPPHKYKETPIQRKHESHRRKKSSRRHSDYICEKEHFDYSTSYPCHEHCAHCQHYYQHCSCCRAHYCCCTRCCLILQERAVIECGICLTCRRRRTKKKRCSACIGKQRRSSSPSIACSRDSGIFTQTRYENCNDNEDDVSATLMHKDSLSILQEKYAKQNGKPGDQNGEAKLTKGSKKLYKRISSRHSYY